MIKLFWNTYITFLDEKWNIIKTDVKVSSVPTAHELVYLPDDGGYYRVCNVVHNIVTKTNKCDNIYVITEQHTDDDKLNEKKVRNNLTNG